MMPNVYIFNPTCEMAVANGTISYQPPELLQHFEREAASLMAYFASEHDFVICDSIPPPAFTEKQANAGFKMPQWIERKTAFSSEDFIRKPKNRLLPWGWSPAIHHRLETLKPYCSDEFRNSAVYQWLPQHKQLYCRKTALDLLIKITENCPDDLVIQPGDFPKVCYQLSQIQDELDKKGRLVVKAPYSSSGRGVIFLKKETLPVYKKQWIQGILKKQGFAMCEPLLNVVQDLAVHFRFGRKTIERCGVSAFVTDQTGQYRYNKLNRHFSHHSQAVRRFIEQNTDCIALEIEKALHQSLFADYYEGVIGVDVLVFYDSSNRLKFHPLLEINVRYNMGLLAQSLEQHLAPGSHGKLFTAHFEKNGFKAFCGEKQQKNRLKTENGKLITGFLPLIPVNEKNTFGVWLEISVPL